MELFKVIVSARFERDLHEILQYLLHELKVPGAAEQFLEEVEITVESLSVMPKRFALVKDDVLNQQGYRKCSVKNYLLFYKVFEAEKTVRIYRILFARRSWENWL